MIGWSAAKHNRRSHDENIYSPEFGTHDPRSHLSPPDSAGFTTPHAQPSQRPLNYGFGLLIGHGLLGLFQFLSTFIMSPCNRYYYVNKGSFALVPYLCAFIAVCQLRQGRNMCSCRRQRSPGLSRWAPMFWMMFSALMAGIMFMDACVGIHCEGAGMATHATDYPAPVCRHLTFSKYKSERELEKEKIQRLGDEPDVRKQEVQVENIKFGKINITLIDVDRSVSIANCYYDHSEEGYLAHRVVAFCTHIAVLISSFVLMGIFGVEIRILRR